MHREEIKSSIIRSIGYDPETRVLEVEFLRNQKQDVRPVYQYSDVPPERFAELMGRNKPVGEKHSVGSYFLRMIKPNYKFTKIEEKDETKTEIPASAPPEA